MKSKIESFKNLNPGDIFRNGSLYYIKIKDYLGYETSVSLSSGIIYNFCPSHKVELIEDKISINKKKKE